MKSVVTFLDSLGWLANLMTFIGLPSLAILGHRYVLPLFHKSRLDKILPRTFSAKWNEARMKTVTEIAIVDDQLSDFPVTELRADGYRVSTYKQISLAKTAALAAYDVVFLDMKGIVKDDPEGGGLRLIAELRRINPVQKICAVSSKTFDINATQFFRLADDQKRKPLTAQECRAVISSFMDDLFSIEAISRTVTSAMEELPRPVRAESASVIRRYLTKQTDETELRSELLRVVATPEIAIRLVNLARVAKNAP